MMGELQPEISIVIPLFNEEDNVKILYDEIRQSLDPTGRTYEIVFVDDGSSDGTVEVLKNIKRREQDAPKAGMGSRIVKFSRNFGQTPAIQAGFDHARGDIVVSLDGDLQNDPRDIPAFIEKIEEGFDFVCGWRRNRKDKKLSRVLPSKVANWLIGMLTGVHIHDNGCSLKAYRKDLLSKLKLYSDMHRFIPAMTTIVGANIAEIEVNHRARKFGRAKYGLSRTWKVLLDMLSIEMLIHFNKKPALYFILVSTVFFLFGAAVVIGWLFLLAGGEGSIVLPAASALLFTLCGNILALGVLAELTIAVETRIKQHRSSRHASNDRNGDIFFIP